MTENKRHRDVTSNIPAEWKSVRLGDHAYIKARIGWRGLSSSEYTDSGPYLVAGNHIKGSRIHWDMCDHLSMERYEESLKNDDWGHQPC